MTQRAAKLQLPRPRPEHTASYVRSRALSVSEPVAAVLTPYAAARRRARVPRLGPGPNPKPISPSESAKLPMPNKQSPPIPTLISSPSTLLA